MSVPQAALRVMLAKGLSLADALEIAEAWAEGSAQAIPDYAARIEAKRVADRERLRAKREADDVARQSRDTRATSSDKAAPAPEPARVRELSPRLVISGSVGVVVGAEREQVRQTDDWPAGNRPHLAKLLVDAAGSPWLDPAKSPDLITTMGRLAAWKRDGASWEHDVLPVVAGLCANRRSRISSWKFFDQAVARSIGENRAALDIPKAAGVPFRSTGPPKTIDEKSSASWDYAIGRIAQDEQPPN